MKRLLIISLLMLYFASVAFAGAEIFMFKKPATTSYIINDTFTGTNGTALTSHTADTGQTWSLATGWTGVISIQDGRIYATDNSIDVNNGTPGSANYSVFGELYYVTLDEGGHYAGVVGRKQSAANTMYFCRMVDVTPIDNNLELYKDVAGVYTLLGVYNLTGVVSAGGTYTIELRMSGSTISCYLDGTQRISVTDTDITGAGVSGVHSYNNTSSTGIHINRMWAQ